MVVTKAEERGRRSKVMPCKPFGTIDLEQFDEALRGKLCQPVRRAHTVFVCRPWREGEAELSLGGSGPIQLSNRQHNMIDGASARHPCDLQAVSRVANSRPLDRRKRQRRRQ